RRLFQPRGRRTLLGGGGVYAADLLLRVAGLLVGLLVVGRVDADRRLTGLAVTVDQLALTAAVRGHRVDRGDTGLQRLGHRLPLHHRGRLQLEGATAGGLDLAETVDRLAERVDHTAEERNPHWHRQNLPGALRSEERRAGKA